MFIDYIAIMLLSAMAAYFLLAGYLYRGITDPDQKKWAVGFAVPGVISLFLGLVMCVTWPVIGPYNSAYGEMSALLGAILLGAALAMAMGWQLNLVAGFAFFAGAASIVIGVRFIDLKLTLEPVMSGLGFILSGVAGIFALPTLLWFRNNKPYRFTAAVILVLTALIWAAVVYPAYWMHMEGFGKWLPNTMK